MKLQKFNIETIITSIVPPQEVNKVKQALDLLSKHNATVYLVGGAVRDIVLEKKIKDIDFEVHGITLENLDALLRKLGHLNLIGKSFGVLRWEHSTIDWAIPRTDSAGRKPVVTLDPSLEITQALMRRDLTINAMAINMHTGELVDPFDGLKDLKNKIARSPNPQFFTEDPLRFYRVMQFIGRFNLEPDEALNAVCKTMDISTISQERIYGEFDKLFLYATMPSRGIRWIERIGRLPEVLPELATTVGVLQSPQWHPEGHVFEHIMEVLDAAAALTYEHDEQKLTILSAALCHDLGKPEATYIDKGRIRSTNHETIGLPHVKKLMKRITGKKERIDAVMKLVEFHMAPGDYAEHGSSAGAYKRLALKLAPQATMYELALLATADLQGRNPDKGKPLTHTPEVVTTFLEKAREYNILYAPQPAVLTGADLINYVGSSPLLGTMLQHAYELQINEGILDKEQLKKRVLEEFKDQIFAK